MGFKFGGDVREQFSVNGGGNGGAPATPLRVISFQNRLFTDIIGSAGNTMQTVRWPQLIAQDSKDIILSFNNWRITSASAEAISDPTVTIVDCSVEAPNGTVVPVTFNGQRSAVLSGGTVDYQCDPIPASAFGEDIIAEGSYYVPKGKFTVPVAGNVMPYAVENTNLGLTGAAIRWLNPDNTTPSSTDIAGAYTFTGTAPVTTFNTGFIPIVLGHPVVDKPSYFICGDSIAAGQGDSLSQANKGMVSRAMHDAGALTNPRPQLNFARGGANIAAYALTERWKTYLPYARFGIEEMGTNSVVASTTGLATVQSRTQTTWQAMRDGGLEKIIRTKLIAGTTSTDSFATVENQTVRAGWGTDGYKDQFNAWLEERLTAGEIDYLVDLSSLCDEGDPNKWVVGNTTDGIHPTAVGAEAAAVLLRVAIDLNERVELIDPAAWDLTVNGGTGTATNSPAGTLSLTGDGTNRAAANQGIPTVSGKTYTLNFDKSMTVALNIGSTLDGTDILSTNSAGVGHGEYEFEAVSDTTYIQLYKMIVSTVVVTNVSVL